jgi:hypothetical protein
VPALTVVVLLAALEHAVEITASASSQGRPQRDHPHDRRAGRGARLRRRRRTRDERAAEQPSGLEVDEQENVYIADRGNQRIRRIGRDGRVRTIAGTGVSGFSGDGGATTSRGAGATCGAAYEERRP